MSDGSKPSSDSHRAWGLIADQLQNLASDLRQERQANAQSLAAVVKSADRCKEHCEHCREAFDARIRELENVPAPAAVPVVAPVKRPSAIAQVTNFLRQWSALLVALAALVAVIQQCQPMRQNAYDTGSSADGHLPCPMP